MHPITQNRLPCLWQSLAILLLGALLWYAIFSIATSDKALSIQSSIEQASAAALATQANLVQVNTQADGRDITLTGTVDSQEARQHAEQIASDIHGVRQVINEIGIGTIEQAITPPQPQMMLRSTAAVDPLPDSFPPLDVEAEPVPAPVTNAIPDVTKVQRSIDSLDLSSVSFLLGSATLTDEAAHTLGSIAQTLSAHHDIHLQVTGHTDNTGDASYNLGLSEQRAQSVVDFLVNHGVDESRLSALGMGDRNPIAPNDTREGRILNRRIEFKIINGEN